MVRAVIFDKFGGPEELKIIDIKLPQLKDGEVRIKNIAVGINYIDIDIRLGLYQNIIPSSGLGFDGCGIVEETEGDVGNIKKGDLVAYFAGPIKMSGSYAEERIIHHSLTYPVPVEITPEQVAAVLYKGMAAHYLTTRAYIVSKGSVVLIHAAAGGLGMILTQYAKFYGATVIGTVGHERKVEIAKNNGCDFVINYTNEDFFKKIVEYTDNKGVTAVYDGIGLDTFEKSIKCIRPFGLMVNLGHCSGVIKNVDLDLLRVNSIYLTSTNIFKYKENRMEALLTVNDIFELLQKGAIKDNINIKYKFDEVAMAHKDIANRLTVGSNILIF